MRGQAMVGRADDLRGLHLMQGEEDDGDLDIADFLLADDPDFALLNGLEEEVDAGFG